MLGHTDLMNDSLSSIMGHEIQCDTGVLYLHSIAHQVIDRYVSKEQGVVLFVLWGSQLCLWG